MNWKTRSVGEEGLRVRSARGEVVEESMIMQNCSVSYVEE